MKKYNTVLTIGAFVVLAFLLVFSGVFSPKQGEVVEAPSSTLSTTDLLTSSVWVWQETRMNDDSIKTPSAPNVFTLTFSNDGSVKGTTDCNSFFGTYTLAEDNSVTFGPMGSTKMFCEGSNEQVFMKDIESSQIVFFTEIGDLVLLLPYDSGSIIFRKQ